MRENGHSYLPPCSQSCLSWWPSLLSRMLVSRWEASAFSERDSFRRRSSFSRRREASAAASDAEPREGVANRLNLLPSPAASHFPM